MYQGHAAGREESINTHVINVYKKTLDILKTDNKGAKLKDAVFKLYQEDNVNGLDVPGLNGKYVEVASGTSGNDGIAHLDSNTEDVLKTGITYYLVEDQAPQNYEKLDTVSCCISI